ncbi:MAG: hypothetical protein KR126chlam2_00276 [Chlamydiae bacterium]|nr:hypothetical protein [Chlamydiota bacterium]
MSISGPNPYEKAFRIQPVDNERDDDHREEKRKRKVLYHGRAWSESKEDNLPVQPKLEKRRAPEDGKKSSRELFADQMLIEKAKQLFGHLTTREEKIAQLFFYQTEAVYDPIKLKGLEELVQTWQIGGILFSKGDYKRQSYLIEHLQELSKTKLLIGNDFLHGLSFYFQGALPLATFQQRMTAQRYSDLGKAVMVQNRRLGVHFQLDHERVLRSEDAAIPMDEVQIKAFRKGIREALGIVGKEQAYSQAIKDKRANTKTRLGPFVSPIFDHQQIQETVGIRTLNFCDLSTVQNEIDLAQRLIDGLQNSAFEAFLVSDSILTAIRILSVAIREEKISEAGLDRQVMKILILKSLFSS